MPKFFCWLFLFCISTSYANSYDPWQQLATYDVQYEIDLSQLADDETLLWVPLPAENQDQVVLSSTNSSAWPVTLITDSQGNSVAEIVLPKGERAESTITFQYTIERKPSSGLAKANLSQRDLPSNFLAAQKKIPLEGVIQQIAIEEKDKLGSNADLRRGYYDYVYDVMTYSKEGEGWGQGDAIWACQSKYGNCTDFHSLYIGLVRSQNIPARFKIGFPLTPGQESGRHDGYHCWAEVFDDQQGWIPLDASEAKKAGLRNEYYGALPSDRIELTQGRDIVLSDRQKGPALNYFVYPYAESNDLITEKLPVKLTWTRVKSTSL